MNKVKKAASTVMVGRSQRSVIIPRGPTGSTPTYRVYYRVGLRGIITIGFVDVKVLAVRAIRTKQLSHRILSATIKSNVPVESKGHFSPLPQYLVSSHRYMLLYRQNSVASSYLSNCSVFPKPLTVNRSSPCSWLYERLYSVPSIFFSTLTFISLKTSRSLRIFRSSGW